jgi:hypothetical protein
LVPRRDARQLLDLHPFFQDRPLLGSWKAKVLDVEILARAQLKQLHASDFPALQGGVLAVSSRARNVLLDTLLRFGELLPLRCRDGEYWLYNSLTMIDALDMERSTFTRLQSSARIIYVDEPVFIEEGLADSVIFHIPYPHPSLLYVTQEFVELVEANDLVGLGARCVWSS